MNSEKLPCLALLSLNLGPLIESYFVVFSTLKQDSWVNFQGKVYLSLRKLGGICFPVLKSALERTKGSHVQNWSLGSPPQAQGKSVTFHIFSL